ncbi:glycoside hydrolase family 31 protein [Athelia psychrophila]|uniref:Glycoside hydrolase family 31 protein n=1 Tax=Athelia psychrophila TaxID=1759441 RepID=A0A166S8R1_9AGAM|nr:glycoside hydrolase family 31 protein [Fibularhizoctonia sp. CBS 109695]
MNTCAYTSMTLQRSNGRRPSLLSPTPPPRRTPSSSSVDLLFNYQNVPFTFWITLRQSGDILFDTRPTNIPTYALPYVSSDISSNNPSMQNQSLIFENQYLHLVMVLQTSDSIFSLGEYMSSSGFRHNIVQTVWTQDVGDPIDSNLYGNHPVASMHRLKGTSASTHAVLMLSTNGMDVVLRVDVYRINGGTLDMYFCSGVTSVTGASSPTTAIAYAELIANAAAMRAANFPLKTQCMGIDIYDVLRDCVVANSSHPGMVAFIGSLHRKNQHFISILDAAIPVTTNASDVYVLVTSGTELGVFLKNPSGDDYIGQVWPGACKFPDFLAPNTQDSWTASLGPNILPYDGLTGHERAEFVLRRELQHRCGRAERGHDAGGRAGGGRVAQGVQLQHQRDQRELQRERADNVRRVFELGGHQEELRIGEQGARFATGGCRLLLSFLFFFWNHNTLSAIGHEPYRWDSVANASRIAIGARYPLLPFIYTQLAEASRDGTPPTRVLFYEFPTQSELFGVDQQWLIGDSVLVTPVMEVNTSSVQGYLPGTDKWCSWYMHEALNSTRIEACVTQLPACA